VTTTPPAVPNAVDLAGIDRLKQRAANDDPAALAEVVVQFEALFIGMMLESARSASLGQGIFDSPQTDQYLELMDAQVALEMARSGGFGFGKTLLEQLSPRQAEAPGDLRPEPRGSVPGEFPRGLPRTLRTLGGADDTQASDVAARAEEFVARLLPEAETAAAALGVEPRLLLAQAALETGWGGTVPESADGRPANNLFGIKAGQSWNGPSIAEWTLEHENGAFLRKREEFRAYSSTAASFTDYVALIANTPRYASALTNASDPEAYARAVTAAGYATDPEYADKWLSIYHGDRLESALRGLKVGADEPTTE
jgi:flagellar protein FlgJ